MYRYVTARYRRFTIWLMVACTVLSLVPISTTFATGNRLSLSSNAINTSTDVGSSFDVKVLSYVDGDQSGAGSTSGSVQYPSNLLKVVSTSSSGTAYTSAGSPSISVGSNSITFSGSRSSSPSGMALIFTVKFQAISAGTAIVSFSGDSSVNNTTTDRISGVFKLVSQTPPSTSPSPSTPSKPSTQPSSSPPPSTSPTPTITPDATAPTDASETTPDPTGLISDVNVTSTYTGGALTWKINTTHATSSLAYGSQPSSLDKQAPVKAVADGSYSATIDGLVPGIRYYFVISGAGDGDKNGTYTGTLVTNGFPVELTVTENNAVASNAQVHIGNIDKTAGSNGKITVGLAAGSYTGTITTSTASQNITFTVATKTVPTDGSTPESQAFAFNLSSSVLQGGPGSGNTILVFVGVLVGSSLLLVFGFIGFMAYRRNKFESGGDSGGRRGPSTTVIIDDGYDWRQEASTSTQDTVVTPDTSQEAHRNSSVYIDDEEPVDMFDVAKKPPQ